MYKLNAKQHYPTLMLLMNTIMAEGINSDGQCIYLHPYSINAAAVPLAQDGEENYEVLDDVIEQARQLNAGSQPEPPPRRGSQPQPPPRRLPSPPGEIELPPLPARAQAMLPGPLTEDEELPALPPACEQLDEGFTAVQQPNLVYGNDEATPVIVTPASMMYGAEVPLSPQIQVPDENIYGNPDQDAGAPLPPRTRAAAPLPVDQAAAASEEVYEDVPTSAQPQGQLPSYVPMGADGPADYVDADMAGFNVPGGAGPNRLQVRDEGEYSILPGAGFDQSAVMAAPAPMAFEEEEYSVLPPPRSAPAVVAQDDETYDALPPARSAVPAPAFSPHGPASLPTSLPTAAAAAVYGDGDGDTLSMDMDLDDLLDQALRDVDHPGPGAAPPTGLGVPSGNELYGNLEMDTHPPFAEPGQLYGNSELDTTGYGVGPGQPAQEDIYGNDEMMQADGQAQLSQAAAFRSHHGGPVEAYDVSAGSVGQFQADPPYPTPGEW